MKNFKVFSVILGCLLVLGLVLAACDSGTTGGGGGGKPSTYTVSFHANGGTGTVPPDQTVSPGTSITLPNGSGLSKSGSSFDGWNTNEDGTGTNYALGSSYTPSGNIAAITLYAKWDVTTYTITFNANGATSGTVPASRSVPAGYSTANLPDKGDLSLVYAEFTGWNTKADGSGTPCAAGSSYTPTGNNAAITLYAQWNITTPFDSVTGFEEKLIWLQAHAQNNTSYTVEANADESISPKSFGSGNSGITITLKGAGSNRKVSGNFTVNSGVTLVLDNNITLLGRTTNNNSLVSVKGGTLKMNAGSAISGNSSSSFYGGGVYVASDGTFTMSGGTISGNTVSTPSGLNARDSSSGGGGCMWLPTEHLP